MGNRVVIFTCIFSLWVFRLPSQTVDSSNSLPVSEASAGEELHPVFSLPLQERYLRLLQIICSPQIAFTDTSSLVYLPKMLQYLEAIRYKKKFLELRKVPPDRADSLLSSSRFFQLSNPLDTSLFSYEGLILPEVAASYLRRLRRRIELQQTKSFCYYYADSILHSRAKAKFNGSPEIPDITGTFVDTALLYVIEESIESELSRQNNSTWSIYQTVITHVLDDYEQLLESECTHNKVSHSLDTAKIKGNQYEKQRMAYLADVRAHNDAIISSTNERYIKQFQDSFPSALNYLLDSLANERQELSLVNLVGDTFTVFVAGDNSIYTFYLSTRQGSKVPVRVRNLGERKLLFRPDPLYFFDTVGDAEKQKIEVPPPSLEIPQKLQRVPLHIIPVWTEYLRFHFSLTQLNADEWINVNSYFTLRFSADYLIGRTYKGRSWNNRVQYFTNMQQNWTKEKYLPFLVTDELTWDANYALRIGKKWQIDASLRLTTHLLNTSKYDGEGERLPKLNRGFFSPAVINIGTGISYLPIKGLTLTIHPLSGKLTYVLLDTSKIDPQAFIRLKKGQKKGLRSQHELGATAKGQYKRKWEKISLESDILMFSNYSEGPERIDFTWTTTLQIQLLDFLSATFRYHLKYDDDQPFRERKIDDNGQVYFKEDVRLQRQHLFLIGINANFASWGNMINRAKSIGFY